jgi:hypothetical protein
MKLVRNRAARSRFSGLARRSGSQRNQPGLANDAYDNATAAGRQQNRRVELVVSGEILGTTLTTVRTSGSSPNQR